MSAVHWRRPSLLWRPIYAVVRPDMVNQLILKSNLDIKKPPLMLEEACLMGFSGGLSKENRGGTP
jgi:hypothetical protein